MKFYINENFLNEDADIALIKASIVNGKTAYLNYEDAPGRRLVEVELIGNTKTGKKAIRAYQVSGPTQTQNNSWKIFLISKITDFQITDNDSEPNRPNLNLNGDKEFIEIFYKRNR